MGAQKLFYCHPLNIVYYPIRRDTVAGCVWPDPHFNESFTGILTRLCTSSNLM